MPRSCRTRWRAVVPLAIAAALAVAPAAVAGVHFTDVTQEAGVAYVQHAARGATDCLIALTCEPERMTGGAAVADVDGDGDLDLFVTRLDAPGLLFRNRGDGTFDEASAEAGLAAYDVQANGAAFGDLDNDGDPDLVVTVVGDVGAAPSDRNYLFMNDGAGRFVEEAVERGAADAAPERERTGFSVALGDYDGDGWLDIHTTEWLRVVPSHSSLLRNRGAAAPGTFEDVTAAAGVDLSSSFGFASAFVDLDDDGHPDLAVAADFGTSRLFWNQGDGTFVDGTAAAGVGTDENGMGSTIADYDGDGDLDWFVTSIFDVNPPLGNWEMCGNRLYRNEGGRAFSDATDAAGVRDGSWGWGAAFFDLDNDRDLDLVMTNGVDFATSTRDDAFNADAMRLWINDGAGAFAEEAEARGVADTGSGKGLLVFDYDGDGDLDLFVVNNAAGPRLYRNEGGNAGGWLRVRAAGTFSNRDGIGAHVFLTESPGGPAQRREVGSITHFLAQSDPAAHFGLGDGNAPVSLRIVWPGGLVQDVPNVPRNRVITVEEGRCLDVDGDGACGDVDCDDASAEVHPGAADLPGDSRDQDCDGAPACDPAAAWRNHGRLLACVTDSCRDLVAAGAITGEACAALIRDAARSDAGGALPPSWN